MVGTRDEYIEAMRQAKDDEMTEFDRTIVGGWVRLEVPFDNIAKLKQWRDLMAGFLATVDFYCQPRAPGTPYISERGRLFHLRSEATNINRQLRGYRGPGRPKKFPQAVQSVDNVTKLK